MSGSESTGAVRPTLASMPPVAVPPVSVPDALTDELTLSSAGVAASAGAAAGARAAAGGGLLTLVTGGAAPVCDGDSCFVPGAEGAWTEVPD